MLSLPRLERNKTIYKNPFRIRILLFPFYSFEIETTNMFMHSRISGKIIPELRPKQVKSIPVFTPKRRKNQTLWGGTYL